VDRRSGTAVKRHFIASSVLRFFPGSVSRPVGQSVGRELAEGNAGREGKAGKEGRQGGEEGRRQRGEFESSKSTRGSVGASVGEHRLKCEGEERGVTGEV
jgi:hypothetical protein